MQKLYFGLLLLFFFGYIIMPSNVAAQSKVGVKQSDATTVQTYAAIDKTVNWITFEQAVSKSKTEKRKIFIDVYTDWCGWCKVMDRKTFSDPFISKLLNEKYYAVKLDAEQREVINFDNHVFKFVENGRSGYHQLAAALLNNQMSYPSVVFLDEDFKMIQVLPGFKEAPEFHKILQYIGDGSYPTQKWEDFQTSYKSPY